MEWVNLILSGIWINGLGEQHHNSSTPVPKLQPQENSPKTSQRLVPPVFNLSLSLEEEGDEGQDLPASQGRESSQYSLLDIPVPAHNTPIPGLVDLWTPLVPVRVGPTPAPLDFSLPLDLSPAPPAEVDLTSSLLVEEEDPAWQDVVQDQVMEEELEELALVDELNNHPHGLLPHPVGDAMLYPNHPTPGELQQEVGGGALAWCQRIFGTEGPITLSQMLALLQIHVPEEGDEQE